MSPPKVAEPTLPVIDEAVCPGEGRVVRDWEVTLDHKIFSSWQDRGLVVGTLRPGKVTVLAGVSVIREPDTAIVKHAVYGLSVQPGDVVFRYGIDADGNENFWSKGAWFKENSDYVADKGCGFADKDECTIEIAKYGAREWWLEVKTATGALGWVLAEKDLGGEPSHSGDFTGLCSD